MKKDSYKTGIVRLCCLLSLTAALTGCSTDSDEPESTASGRQLRQLTISAVPVTRATLTDNTTTLGAAWSTGDEATLVNISALPQELLYGQFRATSDAVTSTFTGSISCGVQDKLAFIYPKVTPAAADGAFIISLSGQKGTLADVAERYHYIYGTGEVTSVSDATATAVIPQTQPLLALAKFTFKDKATDKAIPVTTLTINYKDDYTGGVVGYPQTATVEPKENPDNLRLELEAQGEDSYSPLTVTLDAETSDGVYVALFPCTGEPFSFSVTGSEGTYTGTAHATLKAGKYYPVALKLNKQN